MSAETSTLDARELRPSKSATSMRGEWQRFGAFVKQPALPPRVGAFSFAPVYRMLVLDIIIMMALFLLAGLALVFGATFPENSNSSLEPTLATFALAVVLAPLLEELFFRGPLSGRPAYLMMPVTVVIIGLIAALNWPDSPPIMLTVAAVGLAIAAIIVLSIKIGKRPAASWFIKIFPWLFWISCTGFAVIHFVNYTDGFALILIPLVAPQFVLGTICGYLRVKYGLLASVVLHALHNSIALGIAFLIAPMFG